jgi:hypothetical protein
MLVPKSYYNFDLYPSVVVAPSFKNVRVKRVCSADDIVDKLDVAGTYASVKPYLPTTLSTNPYDFTYLVLETDAGIETVIAYEWIIVSTIEEVTNSAVNIRLQPFNVSQLSALRAALVDNGFTNIVSIEMVS